MKRSWCSAWKEKVTANSDCLLSGSCSHRLVSARYIAVTGPCQRIEGAVDGGLGDVGEAEVVVAGVGPQPGEGLGQVDAGAFGDHAFGLLDHHAAGQGGGQLLVQALGLGGWPDAGRC